MKKIFILGLLIAPIVANATGPAQFNGNTGNEVRADSFGPYQTATIENDDSTTVVSASYVKGAYNDAIAAINTQKYLFDEAIAQYNNELNGKRVSALATWGSNQTTDLELLDDISTYED